MGLEAPHHTWVFAYGSLVWNPGFAPAESVQARLEGYAGEDFFWFLLTEMLKTHSEFDGAS